MAINLGFRVGLLLDKFFSDRRRKCYFFINTEKINTISELRETLTEKFALPSDIQLMHNGFLLLDEDTVFVVRQDEAIEVVPSLSSKKISHEDKAEHTSPSLNSELQSSTWKVKNIDSKGRLSISRENETSDALEVETQENRIFEKVKKKKKRKRDHSTEGSPSVYQTIEGTEGITYHSSPLICAQDSKRFFKTSENESHWSSHNHASESSKTPSAHESRLAMHESCQRKSVAFDKNSFLESAEISTENENMDSSRSLKRKLKNEQNRLKYSGVSEILKQIQTGASTATETVENVDETANTTMDDSCSKGRRKRTRRRKKRSKSKENNSTNSTLVTSFEKTVPVRDVSSSFNNKARIHKRFNSNEDISSNLIKDKVKAEYSEVTEDLNPHSRLCAQISPLTPPSENNSEDDVYKKLLDLKKLNKPVVFERMIQGEVRDIDDTDRNVVMHQNIGAIPQGFEEDLRAEQMELADCDEVEMQFETPLSDPKSSNNSDKDDASSGAENVRSESDGSRKEAYPVHIKKNICDINLEKIDTSNYPVIQSTRKDDILVFKTLKLSASSPTLSSLILARVLDVTGNLIAFEILGGQEELDFMKDDSIIEESQTPNLLITLNWTELYEPRLLYP